MNDPQVALAVGTLLESLEALQGCAVCAHFERIVNGEVLPAEPEIPLPAVLIESKSDPLAGSATYATATVQLVVESQSDDDSAAVHNARASAVVAAMADFAALSAAFRKRGLQLLGKAAPTQSDPDVEQRALRAVFPYKIGYQS